MQCSALLALLDWSCHIKDVNVVAFLEKFRFSAEFIELRRRGLDVFVNRIASHPQLRQSEDLQNFLQADEEGSRGIGGVEVSNKVMGCLDDIVSPILTDYLTCHWLCLNVGKKISS
eukprot:Gb_16176 [translate_table: standard]